MAWQARLTNLYRRAGDPAYRQLGRLSGISHTHITNIIEGRSIPTVETLTKLLEALEASPEAITATIKQFEAEHPKRQVGDAPPKPHLLRPSQADVQALTAAINRLTEKLDESLQESRRWPRS
jgi:transcriptional regulator with XRE-family HTH domain